MGCDIHMYAEVKIKGQWKAVGRAFKDDYYEAEAPTLIDWYNEGGEWESNKIYTVHPYHDRNYRLFSILANVRNNDGIKPIADPRGIPNDASKFVEHEVERYGINGHSHSWLSLQELEAYPWDAIVSSRGVVDQEEYQTFKREGRPDSWCGGVGGNKVIMVDNEEMEQIIALGVGNNHAYHYYTAIQWQWKAGKATGDFSDIAIPALRALLEKWRVDDVRIVFFFDN